MPKLGRWSAAPEGPGLKIKWGDGWVEDFPEDEFAEECKARPRRIRMYRRGEDPVIIEYMLTVVGRRADLDYGGTLSKKNRSPERDIYIGVTRISFTDRSRTTVKAVLWKDEGERGFKNYDPLASWSATETDKLGSFIPPRKDERKRRELSSVLRPGQMRFRSRLLATYARRCAVTGCAIESALEAAHIMPYLGLEYDHPQNGMLMRADLHRLFDAGLWSINPRTMRVRLGTAMRAMPDYSSLESRTIRLPRESAAQPSRIALQDHWAKFENQS
jgi:hypothetical protein